MHSRWTSTRTHVFGVTLRCFLHVLEKLHTVTFMLGPPSRQTPLWSFASSSQEAPMGMLEKWKLGQKRDPKAALLSENALVEPIYLRAIPLKVLGVGGAPETFSTSSCNRFQFVLPVIPPMYNIFQFFSPYVLWGIALHPPTRYYNFFVTPPLPRNIFFKSFQPPPPYFLMDEIALINSIHEIKLLFVCFSKVMIKCILTWLSHLHKLLQWHLKINTIPHCMAMLCNLWASNKWSNFLEWSYIWGSLTSGVVLYLG